MQPTKEAESSRTDREHLVRILTGQIERTFVDEGHGAGLRRVADLFRRLDDAALRAVAYQYGLTTESDLEPDETDQRS